MTGVQTCALPIFDKAKLVVREMAERLALDLLSQSLVTDQVVLTVGYDREGLTFLVDTKECGGEVFPWTHAHVF